MVFNLNIVYGDIYACLCMPTRVSLLANILTSSVPWAAKFLWGLHTSRWGLRVQTEKIGLVFSSRPGKSTCLRAIEEVLIYANKS